MRRMEELQDKRERVTRKGFEQVETRDWMALKDALAAVENGLEMVPQDRNSLETGSCLE